MFWWSFRWNNREAQKSAEIRKSRRTRRVSEQHQSIRSLIKSETFQSPYGTHLEHLIPKKGSWVLSLKSVHCPNLTVHTSNRSKVFNTLRRLHHFGCMHQLLPNISSICNQYQSYGQYDFPQKFKIAECLFVNITCPSHNSCCSIAFEAFLRIFVGHNC